MWWNWWCWSSYEQIADGYKEGVDWFPTLDPTWQEFIGARTTTIVNVGCEYWTVKGRQLYPDHCDEFLGIYPCDANIDYDCKEEVYQLQTIQKPSDGFILAESAMNGPGMNYDVQFMDGSNHLQMRNDSKMEQAILKIFVDGIEENRNYFNTDER